MPVWYTYLEAQLAGHVELHKCSDNPKLLLDRTYHPQLDLLGQNPLQDDPTLVTLTKPWLITRITGRTCWCWLWRGACSWLQESLIGSLGGRFSLESLNSSSSSLPDYSALTLTGNFLLVTLGLPSTPLWPELDLELDLDAWPPTGSWDDGWPPTVQLWSPPLWPGQPHPRVTASTKLHHREALTQFWHNTLNTI